MLALLKNCFTAKATLLSYHDHGEVWAEISAVEGNEFFTYSPISFHILSVSRSHQFSVSYIKSAFKESQ